MDGIEHGTKHNIQLLRFEDRKQVPYMLSPTHEEEITSLVSRISQSYKDLPLRLYQISASPRRTDISVPLTYR